MQSLSALVYEYKSGVLGIGANGRIRCVPRDRVPVCGHPGYLLARIGVGESVYDHKMEFLDGILSILYPQAVKAYQFIYECNDGLYYQTADVIACMKSVFAWYPKLLDVPLIVRELPRFRDRVPLFAQIVTALRPIPLTRDTLGELVLTHNNLCSYKSLYKQILSGLISAPQDVLGNTIISMDEGIPLDSGVPDVPDGYTVLVYLNTSIPIKTTNQVLNANISELKGRVLAQCEKHQYFKKNPWMFKLLYVSKIERVNPYILMASIKFRGNTDYGREYK